MPLVRLDRVEGRTEAEIASLLDAARSASTSSAACLRRSGLRPARITLAPC